MIRVQKVKGTTDVKVTFALDETALNGPNSAVSVVGDFNEWSPFSHVLRKRSNGSRSASITVPAGGKVRFRYLATNGQWFDDDDATEHHDDGGVLQV